MKVIFGIGKVKDYIQKNPFDRIVTIGIFDGLHIGHKKLIMSAIDRARQINAKVSILTFYPHPISITSPNAKYKSLVSLDHRLKLLSYFGVDECFVLKFTKNFSLINYEKFFSRYLLEIIKPREVFIGKDFRFGKDRLGTFDKFKQLGDRSNLIINGVETLKKTGQKISTSNIKKLVSEGKLSVIKSLLNREYSVLGIAQKGFSRGRSMGFPTVNIYPKGQVILLFGVYAVEIIIEDKKYFGMANVGIRPSFSLEKQQANIEVNIFDFNKEIYKKEVLIIFKKRIRSERKFVNSGALVQQLKKDKIKISAIFKNLK